MRISKAIRIALNSCRNFRMRLIGDIYTNINIKIYKFVITVRKVNTRKTKNLIHVFDFIFSYYISSFRKKLVLLVDKRVY